MSANDMFAVAATTRSRSGKIRNETDAPSIVRLACPTTADKPVPEKHLAAAASKSGAVPEGVSVFGYQVQYDRDFSCMQLASWHQIARPGTALFDPNQRAGYKVVLQYRYLILLGAYWPHQPATFAIASGVHVPLFPARQLWVSHTHPRLNNGRASMDIMKEVADSLAVLAPGLTEQAPRSA